jgi:hypothetical protein
MASPLLSREIRRFAVRPMRNPPQRRSRLPSGRRRGRLVAMELGPHQGEIYVEQYDESDANYYDMVVHEPETSRSVDSVGSIEEARAWAEQMLRYPEQETPILAVSIHEPALPGELIGGHLETHARNKIAAELAAQRAHRMYFGGRSAAEIAYDAAGVRPKPRPNPRDSAGPIGRVGPFQADEQARRRN